MKVDFLIVGQGLAGSLLAWQLVQRGNRILVVDRDEAGTSSKVAAGLVTPISGSKFKLPEDLKTRLASASQFYWNAEEATGERFFYHTRIARLFRSEEEGRRWEEQRERNPELEGFHFPLTLPESFSQPAHGGFEMAQGGWLDVPTFLEATRQWLLEQVSYAIGSVDSRDIEESSDGIRWKNVAATRVIFAEGWKANENRFFKWLPANPAAGDILTLRIPRFTTGGRIVNQGKWLLPLGNDRFKVGSNYRHDFTSESPCSAAREELETFVRSLTNLPFETILHECAIRPIIRRSQVFAGIHPSHPGIVLFNGLGSKGVLNGPWHASQLADLLVDGTPLPDSVDIRSNFI